MLINIFIHVLDGVDSMHMCEDLCFARVNGALTLPMHTAPVNDISCPQICLSLCSLSWCLERHQSLELTDLTC